MVRDPNHFSASTAFEGGYLFSRSAFEASKCRTATGVTANAACSNSTTVKQGAEDACTLAWSVRLAF